MSEGDSEKQKGAAPKPSGEGGTMSEGNSEELEGKPKKRRGRWLRRLAIAVAVFTVLLLGGGYFAYDWVLGKARVLVVAELAKHGVHVEHDGFHQSPLRGAVFENLTFFTNEKKDKPLLVVSDIALLPNWRQWFDGEEISVKLSMKDSEIRMLAEGEEVGKFEHVNALVTGTASGLTVKRFSAVGNGVDYQLAGRVGFGEDSGKKTDGKGTVKPKHGLLIDFSFWRPLQRWLSIQALDGGKMKIVSNFVIDTADLDAMTASAQLSGQSFIWHGVAFDHFRAEVDYAARDKVVNVKGLDLAYRDRLAKGACKYSLKSKSLQIDALDSQIDVLSLLDDFSGKKTEQGEQRVVLVKPPRMGVSGLLDFEEIEKGTLQIELLETEEVALEFDGMVFAVTGLKGELGMDNGRLHTLDSGISASYSKGDKRLSLNREKGALSLEMNFDMDLADPAAVKATASLRGKRVAWSGVEFDQLSVDASYAGDKKAVNAHSIELSYLGRPLSGSCRYVLGTNTLEIKDLDSQIDFLALANSFSGRKADEDGLPLKLLEPPHVGLNGRLDFVGIEKSTLQIELLETEEVAVEFDGMVFAVKDLKGKLEVDNGRLHTRDSGVSARYSKGDKRLSLDREKGALNLKMNFDMDLANPADVEAKVALRGERVAWSGVEFDKLSVDANYAGEKKTMDAHSIALSYLDRPLSGSCRYVLGTNTLEIKNLDSRIDFLALANSFSGGKAEEDGQALKLLEPPHVGLNGRLDFSAIKNSDLTLQFLEAERVVVVSGKTVVELSGLQGKARFEGGKMHTLEPGLQARFVGGGIALSAEASVMEENMPFYANLKLDNLSVAELMSLSGEPGTETGEEQNGRLFFTYDGSGGKDILLKDGSGDIKLTNADFGRVPIISELFQMLGRMIPSLGQREKGERGEQILTGSYVVENGLVSMDDLSIESDLTRIEAKVGYNLADKMTSFNGKANLSGAVGLVTSVASRLLEIEGGGPVDDINWSLKNLNAAGIVKSGVGGVMDTGKGAVKMGGDTAKGALKATGEATKGTLKIGEKGTQGVLNGAGKVGEGLKKMLPFTKKKE